MTNPLFMNQTLDPKVVLAECAAGEAKTAETLEASNYQFDNDFIEEEPQIVDEFGNFEKRIKIFVETIVETQKTRYCLCLFRRSDTKK